MGRTFRAIVCRYARFAGAGRSGRRCACFAGGRTGRTGAPHRNGRYLVAIYGPDVPGDRAQMRSLRGAGPAAQERSTCLWIDVDRRGTAAGGAAGGAQERQQQVRSLRGGRPERRCAAVNARFAGLLHHGLTDPDAARGWLATWAGRLDNPNQTGRLGRKRRGAVGWWNEP